MVRGLMEKFVTALKALDWFVLLQIIVNMSGLSKNQQDNFFSFKIALFSLITVFVIAL